MRSAIEFFHASRVDFARESRLLPVPQAQPSAARRGRSNRLTAFIAALPPVHQEALRQFYVERQLPEAICSRLKLRPEVLAALRCSARSVYAPVTKTGAICGFLKFRA